LTNRAGFEKIRVSIRKCPRQSGNSPGAGPRKLLEETVIKESVADERRIRRILEEAVHRFNNELMSDEERMLLLDRIKRLRRVVETDAETVDALHSGLDQL
jgi:hypothetical protein